MHQPLSKVAPGASTIFDASWTRERPELAAKMLEAIKTWAYVEGDLATILTAIVRRQARRTVEAFLELSSTRRQRELLEEEAARHLSEPQMEALSVCLWLFSQEAKERNKLVHWLCGWSPSVPDGMILCDPKHQARFNLNFVEEMERWRSEGFASNRALPFPPVEQRRIQVYRTADFDRIIASFRDVWIMLGTLRHALDPYAPADRLLRQLESSPRYQEGLRRLREHPRNEREARQQ